MGIYGASWIPGLRRANTSCWVRMRTPARTGSRGGYATSIIIPTVQVGWSGSGYWLAAWLAVSTFGRFFPHGLGVARGDGPRRQERLELVGGLVPARNIARKDVNALLDMLDAGIEPIP